MIKRDLEERIRNRFGEGKAILLIGPRQVGKTLFNKLLENKNHLFLNGDDPTVRKLLTNPNLEQIKNIIGSSAKGFFWRTVRQQEIDYVEEEAGIVKGYEIKWNNKRKVKVPKIFTETYKTEVQIIDQENFRDFLK